MEETWWQVQQLSVWSRKLAVQIPGLPPLTWNHTIGLLQAWRQTSRLVHAPCHRRWLQPSQPIPGLLNKEIKVIASYKCRSRAHWNISTIWYLSEHQGLSTLKASIKLSVEQSVKKGDKTSHPKENSFCFQTNCELSAIYFEKNYQIKSRCKVYWCT